ncbi:hypothetical protein DTO013E5_6330 [Penicillium roqueforti]|uniref:uncharacterized protein n=1 Tax=Penicillium roqueforti TaxID=5082 RepID=UPI001909903B|nr:uncharacterized protein LCP9604111_5295 [Penicillium roqueforti]KAF9248545.1 hypothetical protein LCP9604111_5295 [Penicillium roqueforti]KAI1832173.1 hypothetical protein CBS147337_6853 [Penicillium roqueforti]KAI2739268.1 hypothetical protein DTO012A1_6096 [Penicillium roqueforti]KAI2753627.1 hypothetical protein DTO013F2_2589 [Penicillium roqueforti]KAI2758181.1 hypothetical protein DTO006G1_7001 [Penicillium roqueforti]
MLPSRDDIAKFISIAPEANEGTALRFLEGAETIDDAISRYYEAQNEAITPSLPTIDAEVDIRNCPPPYARSVIRELAHHHTNKFIEAAEVRSKDEQDMKAALHGIQQACRIFNKDIEPEHTTQFYNCNCDVHKYKDRKAARLHIQEIWSKAVIYPGESAYHDSHSSALIMKNPYSRVPSPFPVTTPGTYNKAKPTPSGYSQHLQRMVQLNATLNAAAQAVIDSKEPASTIWDSEDPETSVPNEADTTASPNTQQPAENPPIESSKPSAFGSLKKMLSKKTPEEKAEKAASHTRELRMAILEEEQGRWPNQEWRQLVIVYQETAGTSQKIADLRARCPIQYLHLLRAGYFEPIPEDWAKSTSNPLRLSIDAVGGWRGVTPGWRGYKDLAEERLYWVSNNTEGIVGNKMKPDVISAMNMARYRMESAIGTPAEYFSRDDICKAQSISETYSKQVMTPFRPLREPAAPLDETMILLEVSESMNSAPLRPNHNEHLITGYSASKQPKSKDIAQAIVRRFSQAMINHDHDSRGYQLVTFADQARYMGHINHQNFEQIWPNIRFGGETRLMLGWQRAKELHFQKHSRTAIYHPMYGWQAGPQTPILRLLIVLDGEAPDMNEFQLDLLGLSWVYVTIFLVGAEQCPNHHRLANELQIISNTNPRVSFLDAQGNMPERFIAHELLKRHLRYNVSFADFETLEQAMVDLPSFTYPHPSLLSSLSPFAFVEKRRPKTLSLIPDPT